MKHLASLAAIAVGALILTGCAHRDPATPSTDGELPNGIEASTQTAPSADPLAAQLKAALKTAGFNVDDVTDTSDSNWQYIAHIWLPGCKGFVGYGITYNDVAHPVVNYSTSIGTLSLSSPPKVKPHHTAPYCGGS